MITEDILDKRITLKIPREIHERQIPVIQAILRDHKHYSEAESLNKWDHNIYFTSDQIHNYLNISRLSSIDDMRMLRNNNEFSFEITHKIDWEAGDFDDEDSCYWGDHESAKDMIIENKGVAICFYDRYNVGVGRCWGASYKGGLVIWNAYGPYYCFTIASVLSEYFNKPFWPVKLDNNGDTDGILYINNYHTYWIGDQIPYRHHIDLEWPDLGVSHCTLCNRAVYPWSDGTDDMCSDCRYEYYFFCDHCGEYFEKDTHALSTESDYICVYCAPKLWKERLNNMFYYPRNWFVTLLDGSEHSFKDFKTIWYDEEREGFILNEQKEKEMEKK